MPRIRCSLLLCNWLIMGTMANCIITMCLHSVIFQWLQLCCNKSLVTWDWSCASDSASLKASDRHRPRSWERQGLWQELGMNFSASYMSVAWKRIFSGEYASVWEGFIRRMYLWRKQRGKSISILLESSWRKHRIGAGKPGLRAGTNTVSAREIHIPQNAFSTPLWNVNSISSFLKSFKRSWFQGDLKDKTISYLTTGRVQGPLTCEWCCVYTDVYHKMSSPESKDVRSPLNLPPTKHQPAGHLPGILCRLLIH